MIGNLKLAALAAALALAPATIDHDHARPVYSGDGQVAGIAYFTPALVQKAFFVPPINVIGPSGGGCAPGTTTIFLTNTGATTWVVDSCFNAANNTISAIGAGAGGSDGTSPSPGYGGAGGCGGSAAQSSNVSLAAGSTVGIKVGVGGARGSPPVDGGDTYICDATGGGCASIAGAAVKVGAKGGKAGGTPNPYSPPTCSVASDSVGAIRFAGGNPGASVVNDTSGSGGGGAAGATAAGGNGGKGCTFPTCSDAAGGAGGGADGGANGGDSSSTTPPTGGAGANSGGNGGNGGATGANGGSATAGQEWNGADCTSAGLTDCGSGGGGGGGGTNTTAAGNGAGGALYGGGAGGGGGYPTCCGLGGDGGQGILRVQYTN